MDKQIQEKQYKALLQQVKMASEELKRATDILEKTKKDYKDARSNALQKYNDLKEKDKMLNSMM